MQLLQATVTQIREVTTRYGQKTVIDCVCEFREETLWRPAGDRLALSLQPGQAIQVTKDSKGKLSLVDNAIAVSNVPSPNHNPIAPYTQPYQPKPETYQAHNGRSAEIADYTERLAKLYSHCYRQAGQTMSGYELGSEDLRAIATTLFIQAVKHFDL